MKLLSIAFLLYCPIFIYAQCTTTIDLSNQYRNTEVGNNHLMSCENFFLQENQEYLSKSYWSNMWLAAEDQSGNLLMSRQTYQSYNSSNLPGPISDVTGLVFENACTYFKRVWTIKGPQIENLKDLISEENIDIAKVPKDILEWPAKGNPYFNIGPENGNILNQELAPFYDHNMDGRYNILDGDLPVFNAKVTFSSLEEVWSPVLFAFSVYNDEGLNTGSSYGVNNIKLEFHQSVYMFNCDLDDDFNNTIFTNFSICYKGDEILNDFQMAFWVDENLACPIDDYVGCLPESNASFVYNMEPKEEFCGGVLHFNYDFGLVGLNVLLNQDLKSYMVYKSSPSGITSPQIPVTPFDFLNYFCGRWSDGMPVTIGGDGYNEGSIDTSLFMFHDPPNDTNGWSMYTENFPEADYRSISGIKQDPILFPGQVVDIDIASNVLMDRDKFHLEIFDGIEDKIEAIKQKHNNLLLSSDPSILCGSFCESDCVWPGDVFPDDIVDQKDILYLGACQGKGWTTGPGRALVTDIWNPYNSTTWSNQLLFVNGKQADTNGDGEISGKDYLACEKNYNKRTFDCIDDIPVPSIESSDSGYKITIDKNSVDLNSNLVGRIFNFSVELQNNTPELEQGFHGIGFDVVFDTSLVTAIVYSDLINTNYFDDMAYAGSFFDDQSEGSEFILFGDDRVRFALTSKSGINQYPTGKLVEAYSLILKEDATTSNTNGEENISLRIENSFILNADGIPLLPIGYSSDEITLTDLPSSTGTTTINESESRNKFQVFPNPADTYIRIESEIDLGGRIDLVDLSGRIILSQSGSLKTDGLSVSELKTGIYFLNFYDNRSNRLGFEKLVIIR